MSYPYVLKIIAKTSNGIGGTENVNNVQVSASIGGYGTQVTMQYRARFHEDQGRITVQTTDNGTNGSFGTVQVYRDGGSGGRGLRFVLIGASEFIYVGSGGGGGGGQGNNGQSVATTIPLYSRLAGTDNILYLSPTILLPNRVSTPNNPNGFDGGNLNNYGGGGGGGLAGYGGTAGASGGAPGMAGKNRVAGSTRPGGGTVNDLTRLTIVNDSGVIIYTPTVIANNSDTEGQSATIEIYRNNVLITSETKTIAKAHSTFTSTGRVTAPSGALVFDFSLDTTPTADNPSGTVTNGNSITFQLTDCATASTNGGNTNLILSGTAGTDWTINSDKIIFAPSNASLGSYTQQYTVTSAYDTSTTGTVTVTITDTAPTASNITVHTGSTATTITLVGSDIDGGQTITYSQVGTSTSTVGSFSYTAGSNTVTYTPASPYTLGSDTFQYKATSNSVHSNTATVTVYSGLSGYQVNGVDISTSYKRDNVTSGTSNYKYNDTDLYDLFNQGGNAVTGFNLNLESQ
jgi:hypothetical protein